MAAPAELNRRERRKLELRGRILEAASELFDARGVAATTVAEIAERADVAQKTFFNHFPTRQDLLREIASVGLDELAGDIEDLRKRVRPARERLAQLFALIAQKTSEHGPMHRELLTELVHAVHESPEKSATARQLHDAFGAIVREGVAAGDVTRRHSVETLTQSILGAYYVLMFDYANIEDFPIRERAAAMARLLGDTLAPAPEE